MKPRFGLLLFAALLLTLIGAGYVAYLHGQASRKLVAAVNRHDAAQVEALLRQGADPNVRDWKTYFEGNGEPYMPPWYEKPLAWIMCRPPRIGDGYVGPTVLMIAAYNGDLEIVQTLLGHGAGLSIKGTSINYDGDTEQVSALYESLPLQLMEENQDGKVLAGKQTVALLLIAHGIPVNEHMAGTTLLHCASVRLDPTIAAALIAKGADFNALDSSDRTPLLQATDCNYIPQPSSCPFFYGWRYNMRTVLLLIASGADVNRQDDQGNTALMHACNYELTQVVRSLLAKGADVNIKNKYGITALKIATDNGVAVATDKDFPANNAAIIKMLKKAGAK